MAEVFVATHRQTPRLSVVLKRILPHLEAKPEFVQMFIDEARITRHFDHPNIVKTLDFGFAEESHFLVLEFVDGLSLSALLKKRGKPLPIDMACWIIAHTCLGLNYAHQRCDPESKPLGIVHRDVSPDNILLSRRAEVKLADFGVAKARIQMARTRPGQLKGKLAYMSPEQSFQRAVDLRSDIFAAGLVLYELTTGHRVFNGANEVQILKALSSRQYTPPDALVPDYPVDLARLLEQVICWDPDERLPTAAHFAKRLAAFFDPSDESLPQRVALLIPEQLDSDRPQGAGSRVTLADSAELAEIAALDDTGSARAITTPFGVPSVGIFAEDQPQVEAEFAPAAHFAQLGHREVHDTIETSPPSSTSSAQTSQELSVPSVASVPSAASRSSDGANQDWIDVSTTTQELPKGTVYLGEDSDMEGFPWGWVILAGVGVLAAIITLAYLL
jgi:serine/threonine protein kinase